MGTFTDTLKTNTLYVKKNKLNAPSPNISTTGGTLDIGNKEHFKSFCGPYVENAKKLADRVESKEEQRLILIGEDMNQARKAALMFCYAREKGNIDLRYIPKEDFAWDTGEDEVDMNDIPWDFDVPDDFYEEEPVPSTPVVHVDFSEQNPDREALGNRFLEKTFLAQFVMEKQQNSAAIVEGLAPGDDKAQRDAIITLGTDTIIVLISPRMRSSMLINDLVYQYGFHRIELAPVPKDYYQDVFRSLVEKDEKLKNDPQCEYMVMELLKSRKDCLDEEMIALALDEYVAGNRMEEKADMSAARRLEALTGLDNVKEIIAQKVAVAKEMQKNAKLVRSNQHMIFTGNPGTGKTTCGMLYSEVMKEQGVGNGVFVVATRSDLIGRYVGHTAPMISGLFERARGGTIFIDEAGFLIQRGTGDYVMEAVKELVRYMELYPDVTVIFALYPRECKEFLHLDEGLASRVGKIVPFADYTEEQMLTIFRNMAEGVGYSVEAEADDLILDYVRNLRRRMKEQYGNAREMRKLLDSAIISISMRHCREEAKCSMELTCEDIRYAIQQDTTYQMHTEKISFGFVPSADRFGHDTHQERNVPAYV